MVMKIRITVLLATIMAVAGCASDPWALPQPEPLPEPLSPQSATKASSKPQSPSSSSLSSVFSKKSDIGWQNVMNAVAVESALRQREIVVKLEQKMKEAPSADLKLRLAFVLGFSKESVRDQAKAVSLFKELSKAEQKELAANPLAALAVVVLTDLQAERGRIWWLKKDKARLQAEKESLQAQIKQLEEKLQAIKSIEESIHQRNR